MKKTTNGNAKDLVRSLIAIVSRRVWIGEVLNSFVMSTQVVLEALVGSEVPDQLPVESSPQEPRDLAHCVWDDIRKRYPVAAAFPLGTVAERAVKRQVGWAIRRASAKGKRPGSLKELRGSLAASVGLNPVGKLIHRFLSYFLFETVMFALRGRCNNLAMDYGFWYHWLPDGRMRSFEQETRLRVDIWRESQQLSSELLLAWNRIKDPKVSCPTKRDILATMDEVLGHGLMESPPWWRRAEPRPVTVLGLKPSPQQAKEQSPIAFDARLIVFHGPNANAQLDISSISQHCGGTPASLLVDLLEIAATVYFADIYVPRDRLLSRDLVLLIPVRHPDLWSANAKALERVVSFLSRNFVEFRFLPLRGEKGSKAKFSLSSDDRCVALFSGGLDSFVGATRLLEDKRSPVLISHYPAPKLRAIQKRASDKLRSDHARLAALPVLVGRAGKALSKLHQLGDPPEQVLYQHTRSFLFMSLAACVALQKGIADVYVHENGPVALNPTFSEARINTRTTHPVFFEYFKDLIRSVFNVDLEIHNPFSLMTKGETVELLEDRWTDALSSTNSCWSYARVPVWAQQVGLKGFKGGHCGRCLPCVWRRAAVHHAGLDSNDDLYLTDQVPVDRWSNWLSRSRFTLLIDQLRFCQNAVALSDEALLDLCPDFCEMGSDPLADRLAMYRRFSGEIVSWFEAVSDNIYYAAS